MTENALISFAAVLLSIGLNWIPKLRDWYANNVDGRGKRLLVLGSLAAAPLVVFGANCAGFQIPGVEYTATCDAVGAKQLVQVFINAVVVNQVAGLVVPKPKPA